MSIPETGGGRATAEFVGVGPIDSLRCVLNGATISNDCECNVATGDVASFPGRFVGGGKRFPLPDPTNRPGNEATGDVVMHEVSQPLRLTTIIQL